MSMFFNMVALSDKKPYKQKVFAIDLAITADNLTFGVTPYWNSGGYCNIVDWGDGATQAAATSGTALNHTYAAAGTYHVKVRGDMYRFRVGSTNPGAVTFCNGNWSALGNITDGGSMFINCANMDITVGQLPAGLISAQSMFNGCIAATLPLTSLPAGLTSCGNMFQQCEAATMMIPALPAGITNANYMFYRCRKMTADLDTWCANNPGGWSSLTTVNNFARIAGNLNTPGTFTGSVSAFEALCPSVSDWTTGQPFYGTNTTA